MTVNCARLIKTDQHATNGIVHVVDRVITAISNNVHSFIDTDDDLETLRVSVAQPTNADPSIPQPTVDESSSHLLLCFINRSGKAGI